MDSQGRIVYVNEAACRSLERSREELLALSIPDIDPLVTKEAWGTVWEAVKAHGSQVLVTQHQTKQGRTFPVEVTANYLEFDGTEYSFAFARDITKRMRAEEALRESEERYRTLFQRNLAGVLRTTTDGQVLECNQAMANILGFDSPQRAPDRRVPDFYFSDEERAAFLEKLKVDGRLTNFEMRLRHNDGNPVWVIANVNLGAQATNGSRIIESTLIDITKRKLAETESAYLAAIVTSSDDAILSVTREGLVTTWNAGAERMYGYTPEEIKGKHFSVFIPEDRRGDLAGLDDRLIRGEPLVHYEAENVRKDGSKLQVSMTLSPIKDATGFVTGASVIARDVTERKCAEEKLRNSEEQFRQLAENIHEVFFIAEPDPPRLTYLSPAYEEIWGRPRQEAYERADAWIDTIHPDDRERAIDLFSRAHRGEQANADFRIARRDGTVSYIKARVFPVRDAGGKFCRVVGIAEDVTDFERAEAEMAERHRLATLVAEVGAALTRADSLRQGLQKCAEILVRNASGAFVRVWTVNEEENVLELQASAGLYTPVDGCHGRVSTGKFEIGRITESGEPHLTNSELEDSWVGDPEWARREGMVAFAGYGLRVEGLALGVLAAFARQPFTEATLQAFASVTDNIAQFIKRKRAEASRDYLASIVESSDDAIIGKTLEGVIRSWNAGAEKQYGYTASEVIGQSISLLVPPERRQEVEDSLNRIKGGEQIAPHETVRVRKDGKRIDVSLTISPLKNEHGEVVGASTVARDITERRELERMKSEIVSVVSHELRTPLTSIRGALGLLSGGLLRSQPEKGARMLEIAVSNTDRLVRLINDILDLERLESGKMNMEKQTCNAADLMTQAVDNVRELAEKAGVTLSVSLHSARLWVDPDRIIQSLINLLSNAIKFSPRGKTVWLSATPQADQILFQVKDQGRGIPQEKRESIFERFQQVDASDRREKGGTGLGLPITRSIVQQHGGRIWVESTLGQGSTFFFTLPALPTETISVGGGSGARKVLVCAVQADICGDVQAVLMPRGYTVMAAESWQEAIEMASMEPPDAILLDSSMPGMESFEAATALKQKFHTRDVPVIGLGGTAPDEAHLASMAMAGWVTKPLNQGSLLPVLESVLGKRSEGPRVLVIEDDADLARVLTTIFERHGAVVLHARTGQEGVHICPQFMPDLLVLDVLLPELDGFGVVERLRQQEHLRRLPLAVYSVKELNDSEKARLRLGESIFMTKSRLTPQEFEQRAIGLLNWAISGKRERRRQ
jgi:PAS domain S-box-containing protein